MAKRILGIDYGRVRTGFAVSDILGLTASPIGTFKASADRVLVEKACSLAKEYDVCEIVMGNPINMDGSRGDSSSKVQYIASLIEKDSGLPVILFDERCTTMLAHKLLCETDTRGVKRKNVVDTLSAQIILQNYLDSRANKKL